LNYGNRNASSPYTLRDLMRGYFGAVAASVFIVYFLRLGLTSQLSSLQGSHIIIANAALNYLAASFAGASNLILMRQKELFEGITVQNLSGTINYGKSIYAGRKAVFETATSRFIFPFPPLFVPALTNYALESFNLWPENFFLAKLLESLLIISSLVLALPMSIALFK